MQKSGCRLIGGLKSQAIFGQHSALVVILFLCRFRLLGLNEIVGSLSSCLHVVGESLFACLVLFHVRKLV